MVVLKKLLNTISEKILPSKNIQSNEHEKNNTGPLSGLRVLDLSRILAGPTCTQLLGDYGADVIKVEKPGKGDDTRAWGPPFTFDKDGNPSPESGYYLASNRNKRSIAIDISTNEGVKAIKSLLPQCDVLIENFKVGSLKNYGLDYQTLSSEFPELIYCSITGFGQIGPNAHKAGYDLIAQGFSGLMSITGEQGGEPMKVGVAVSDILCGLYACTAILAALQSRNSTGEGQQIDIGLVDSQIASLVNMGTNYFLSKKDQERVGNQHPNIVPYQVFEVSDGHLIVAVGNDSQFEKLCKIFNRTDLAVDIKYSKNINRVANRTDLIAILSNEFKKYTKDHLIKEMEKLKIPGGPINKLSEVFSSDQVSAREMKISMKNQHVKGGSVDLIGNPVKFSKTPVSYRSPPPSCGQHTDEILSEFQVFHTDNKSKK